MTEPTEPSEPDHQGHRAKLRSKLHEEWTKGITKSHTELLKTKLSLQHTLGLGARPNVIPPSPALIDGPLRTVSIGWHPVAGMGGTWFAEKSSLGKIITKSIGRYPDPTQHWAVLVGEYVHELWMDEALDVIYVNERRDGADGGAGAGAVWHTFEVGGTRFTDEALRQAAEMVIHNMRQKRPAYNVISNNCQNFAVALLDAIQIGKHQEFATTFAIYQRATGSGSIKDLFLDKHPEEQKVDSGANAGRPELVRVDTVQNAVQVMDEHTTKLDDHHSLFS